MQVPTKEPTYIQPGVTVKWQKTFTNYSYADGYTTRYYTISGNVAAATVTGTYADGVWTFTLTAANNTLAKGTYRLVGYVEAGSGASLERYSEYSGTLTVTDDTTTAVQTDQRSYLQQQYDLINDAINEYLNSEDGVPVEMLTVNGKTLQRPSLQTLYKVKLQIARDLRNEIKKENIRNGRRAGGQILVNLQ
ncbi:MAG: hypothetical protein ACYC09_14770 [Bacteroidota bacterium]